MPSKQIAFTPTETDMIKFKVCQKYVERETGHSNPATVIRYSIAQLYKKASISIIDKELINTTVNEILGMDYQGTDMATGISVLEQILERFYKEIGKKQ